MNYKQYKKLYLSSYEMKKDIFFSKYNYIKDYSSPVHGHDFYELFLVSSGSFLHFKNGVETILPANTLALITPSDIHSLKGCEDINSIYNFAFSASKYSELIDKISIFSNFDTFPAITLSDSSAESTIEKISFLERENLELEKILLSMFLDYFIFTSDVFLKEKYSNQSLVPPWLRRAVREMENPDNLQYGLKKFIELSGKTQEYLSRSMKKYFNITATEWINNHRLEMAKFLLSTTDKPILDILFEIGFESESYFYRLFKKKYGVTPKAYRSFQK